MQRPPGAILTGLLVVGGVCLALLLLDYFHTRSAAKLALVLARFGPDTPLETYVSEFGQPIYHFTDADLMKSRGARTDDALLSRTELYYFGYWGLPHRFVAVYIDKGTHRSVVVSWKYM